MFLAAVGAAILLTLAAFFPALSKTHDPSISSSDVEWSIRHTKLFIEEAPRRIMVLKFVATEQQKDSAVIVTGYTFFGKTFIQLKSYPREKIDIIYEHGKGKEPYTY